MALKFLNDGYFAGKVGIGTLSPSTRLHLDQSSNDRAGGLYIERNASNYGLSMFVNSGGYGVIGSNGTFTTDILTLDLNLGNVGIGTNNPSGKLDIAYTGTGGSGTQGIGEGLNITSLTPNVTFNDTSSNVDNYAVHLNQNVFTIGRYTSATAQNPDLVLKSGNVGIGTASPLSQLSIGSNAITTKKPTVIIADGVAGGSLVIRGLSPILSFDRTGSNPENKILMDGVGLEFKTGSLDAEGDVDFKIKLDGKLQAPAYTQGFLQSDASGNIEISGGGTLPGGPYLPLSAGSSYPLTSTLYGTNTNWSGSGDYAGSLTLGTGASTQEAHLQIGQGRTGDGFSYIDLIGDATYTDYGLRIIRNNGGPNTTSAITHRGTGNFSIGATDSASILLRTNNVTALTLTNSQNAIFTGNVGIGITNPSSKLHISKAGGVMIKLGTSQNTSEIEAREVGGANALVLSSNNSTDHLLIDGVGNVGIGTASPSQTLHVAGNARVTGAYYDSNNSPGTANQVLVSTATGTDWVDGSGSSVIGGPYLPLAGNTTATAMTGDLYFANQQQARFLTSTNAVGLRIQSSGTSSFIDNENGDMYIRQEADNNDMIFQADDGLGSNATYFYLDGSITETRFEKHTRHDDDVIAKFGNGNDLNIYHDSSDNNSYIKELGSGSLQIWAKDFEVYNAGGTETLINADVNAGVQLYFDNSTKIATTSTGVTVTGAATATTFLGDLNGTINTATTAVTKANATNDTTVATTAFVQNLIGTIPAGLVFQGTWNAATNTPTLTSGSGTTGNFYIVSVAGSTNLDGITDWKVGDWAVFIEQGASDQWEKIDNSSVLDGSGTGGSVAGWAGSGTSNTLTNAPITFSGNDTTFAGSVGVGGSPGAKLDVNAGITNTVAIFESTDDKAFIILKDNTTSTHLISKDGKFYIGQDSTSYEKFNVDISNGNTNIGGNVTVGNNGNINIPTASSGNANLNFDGSDFKITSNSSSANLKLETNSTTRLTINSSGNATFTGTINSGRLFVEQSGADMIDMTRTGVGTYRFAISSSDAFSLFDVGANTDRLVINSSGKVGIGITSPEQLLTVAGGSISVSGNTGTARQILELTTASTVATIKASYQGSSSFGDLAFQTSSAERMRITSAGAIKFNAYNSTNNTGTPTYLLGTDASGNIVKTNSAPSPITSQAASLYDLIPNGAFTTTYAFTSTAGTYAKVMQGDDVITANGTYTVQMVVDDHAVGGTQYSETYSGIMSWGSSTNTNDTGGGTISEIVLHRSGHAANQGMTYLRTRETTSSEGSELRLEIMCNRTYTGASNVVFKFVRLI